ncbi:hypothetical protein [Paraflavitalea soli]|nr:hypothetical protein [Paraflavitalea soli]
MVDFASWRDNPDPNKDNKLRTAWGYIPAVEYFPFKDLNLKFFVSFVGRVYRYTDMPGAGSAPPTALLA